MVFFKRVKILNFMTKLSYKKIIYLKNVIDMILINDWRIERFSSICPYSIFEKKKKYEIQLLFYTIFCLKNTFLMICMFQFFHEI